MQTQQLVVRLPADQKALFEELAKQEQTTLSKMVRKALEEFLTKKQKQYPGESLMRLAEIGKKSKDPYGPENLSENYKKYLYKL
jgi:predicted transcriptional regulator